MATPRGKSLTRGPAGERRRIGSKRRLLKKRHASVGVTNDQSSADSSDVIVTERNRSVLLKTRHYSASEATDKHRSNLYFTSKDSKRFKMRFLAQALLLFIVSACFPWRGQACCDEGWLMYGSNCYFFNHNPKGQADWNGAAQACRLLGGHLVDIRNEDEWQFVKSHLRRSSIWDYYLIGMSDEAHEGSWKYFDGSAVSFFKWKAGEPNGRRSENCGSMFVDSDVGLYNDTPCGHIWGRFICKKEVAQ